MTRFLRSEYIGLAIPPFFLACLAWSKWFSHVGMENMLSHAMWRGLAYSVLLNAAHVGLSYSTARTHPTAKKWIASSFPNSRRFWILVTSVFALTLFLYLSASGFFSFAAGIPYFGAAVYVYFAYLLDAHAFGQSKGLSLIYNKKKEQTFTRWERCERFLFQSMWLMIFIRYSYEFYFENILKGDSPSQLNWMMTLLFFLGPTLVMLLSIFGPQRSLKKSIFNLRFFLWSFSFAGSFMASFFIMSVHGIEYGLLNHQMIKKSDGTTEEKTSMRRWAVVTLAISFAMACMVADGFPKVLAKAGLLHNLMPFHLVTSVVMAATFVHIFWDKYFYRFESKVGQQTTRPLLVAEPQPEAYPQLNLSKGHRHLDLTVDPPKNNFVWTP